MNNQIVVCVLVTAVIVSFFSLSRAQWTLELLGPQASDQVIRYPYYGNCSLYWICYEDTKSLFRCPDGLEFNFSLQRCVDAEVTNCHETIKFTLLTSSQDAGPECPYPSEELIRFPYEGDCTKYWECYEGDSYLYICPHGMWWHQEIGHCDEPGEYCNDSTQSTTKLPSTTTSTLRTTTIVTKTTTEATTSETTATTPNKCDGEGDDKMYWPYPGDCTKYYECSNGQLYPMDCPNDLWWNPQINDCSYPGDFCDNSTTTQSEGSTNPIAQKEEDSIKISNPDNCHTYRKYRDGNYFEVECPMGLYYSTQKQGCVKADLSECCLERECVEDNN